MARKNATGGRIITYKISTESQLSDFLWTVRDDLNFLRGLDYNNPTRTTVRLVASVVRRLLVDKMYDAAFRFVGFEDEPQVMAVDLKAFVEGVDTRYINYAYAGGAPSSGAQHRGLVMLSTRRCIGGC